MKPGWSSTGSVDEIQLRKKDFKPNSKPLNARRQLSLQSNNSYSQVYLQKAYRRSSFPHVYRHDSRRVSNSSFVDSNSQIKENNTSTSSCYTQYTERSSKISLEKSSSSQESNKDFSKEFLLEFPPMPKSGTSHSSAAKRSEKRKEKKGNLKPAQSMPGLLDSPSKNSRAYSADACPRQSTSCAFFFIFKRKKKSIVSRSSSPDKFNTTTAELIQKSDITTLKNHCGDLETFINKEKSSSRASSKERRISQTSLVRDICPSQTSSARDRCPSQTSSKHHQTPSSSVLSPSTTDKTPLFESRSRLRHRKDRYNHTPTSGSRSHSDPRGHIRHHHISHEDLPPHPSILKHSTEKTKSIISSWSKNKQSQSKSKLKCKEVKIDNINYVVQDTKSLGHNLLAEEQVTEPQKKLKSKQENYNLKETNEALDIDVKHEIVENLINDNIILAGNLSVPIIHSNISESSSCAELPIKQLGRSNSDSDSLKKVNDKKAIDISLDSHKNTSESPLSPVKQNSKCHSSSPKKVSTSDSESSPILKSTESADGSATRLKGKSLISTSKTEPITECCDRTPITNSDKHPVRSRSLPRFEPHIQFDADNKVISDSEDFEYLPTEMKGPLHLSLCGCGFLGMYHLGVITCLSQRAPTFLEKIDKVCGASAGALMAAVLVTSRDKVEESAEHIHNLAKELRKKPLGALTPGYSFTRSLRNMLDDILPGDAHELAQGKLYISLTNAQSKKNELISDYISRDEFIEALIASCYIPVYAGMKMPTIRGKKYIDGGLTNNLPRFETGRTITVSPFDGKSDIGPKSGQELEKKAHFIHFHNQEYQVNMNNFKKGKDAFFPPKAHILQEYFEKGRYDASRFLIREGLYEINTQQQTERVLYESSV
ncbi:hypothetical protein Btru_064249 [Bulinus truncatus]|nr:hypothetical protein Btru_064249 [Bulinus truncatus]